MLESIEKILNYYIDKVSMYTIHSVEMVRGQNIEDRYYLCNVNDRWFVVYETDYVHSLADARDEAVQIYANDNLHPLHWLAKKGNPKDSGETTIPLYDPDLEKRYKDIALVLDGTYLRQATIEFESTQNTKHFHPSTYGSYK